MREYYRRKHGLADFGGEVSEHNRGFEAAEGIKEASQAAVGNPVSPEIAKVAQDHNIPLSVLEEFIEKEGEITRTFDNENFGADVMFVQADSKQEFGIAKDEDAAIEMAESQVRDDLEEMPENFNQDWLQGFVYVSDTDKRLMASEAADNELTNLDDEDILDRAGDDFEARWNELQDLKESAEEAQKQTEDTTYASELGQKIVDFESKQAEIVEEAKEKLHDEIYNEWYNGLDEDPVHFLSDEQGYFSREEALKQSYIQIDVDEAAKDAVSTDGAGHFLSSYDGEIRDLPSGAVYWRIN